jgi:carboxyl-terminal processing protease
VVAKVAGAQASEQVLNADPSRSVWDGKPLAVLTDNGTSGAGEIVAAALLDSGRPVVGEPTFGRAPIQRAVTLPEGGLVLTVARYVSPKGTPIHGKGVTPTVAVKPAADDDDDEATKPAGDPILEKALEVLRGEEKKAAA